MRKVRTRIPTRNPDQLELPLDTPEQPPRDEAGDRLVKEILHIAEREALRHALKKLGRSSRGSGRRAVWRQNGTLPDAR